jgi:aldose 1-epimerase
MTPDQALPSGEQWTIRHGDHEAVVVGVGGGLRTYTFRGRDVLAGYPPDARDFREPHLLGQAVLDTAFTKVAADADGRWRVTLTHARTGRAVTVWADATAYPWVQVFTGDSLPAGARRATGIAVEPMTCAPDAFNSGDGLIVLEPGE